MPIAAVYATTKKYGPAERRPVIIHGQFLCEAEVDAFRRRDTFASLYPVHNFYWGEWHLDHTVGPEFVDNISPTGWLVRRGMKSAAITTQRWPCPTARASLTPR